MFRTIKQAALVLAAPAALVTALPAAALPVGSGPAAPSFATAGGTAAAADTWHHGDRGRHRGWDRGYGQRRYDEPVYRGTRVWRGQDGRMYCRRNDGTTGLIIGAAAGALLGHGIAGDGDRTLGAILGGGAGALLGREVERGGSRCR